MKNSQNACNPYASLGNRQALEESPCYTVGNLYGDSMNDNVRNEAWETVQRANKEAVKGIWMI